MVETAANAAKPTSMWALLRDPRYLAFWAAGALIGIVRWFQLLALSVFAFEITGSPLLVSIVPLLSMVPMAMFGPIIGAVADRVDRKLLFVVSIAGICATSAIMGAIALAGTLHFGHVAVIAFLNGIFWATDMPIRRRLLGDLSGDALPTAMSLDAATGNGTRMLGPLLGGAVLQFVGVQGVFLFSAAVYGLCILLILFVRVQGSAKAVIPTSLIHDLRAGIQYVRGDMHLRRILGITVIFNVFGFPFTSMIPVIGKVHLAQDSFWTGVVSSLEGLGALTRRDFDRDDSAPSWKLLSDLSARYDWLHFGDLCPRHIAVFHQRHARSVWPGCDCPGDRRDVRGEFCCDAKHADLFGRRP